MAEQKSIFRDIVALRWPDANPIFGDGSFAMLSRCPQKPFVRLYESVIEADLAAAAPCGHAFCTMRHVTANVSTPPAPRYVKKPHWSKFIEEDD